MQYHHLTEVEIKHFAVETVGPNSHSLCTVILNRLCNIVSACYVSVSVVVYGNLCLFFFCFVSLQLLLVKHTLFVMP